MLVSLELFRDFFVNMLGSHVSVRKQGFNYNIIPINWSQEKQLLAHCRRRLSF